MKDIHTPLRTLFYDIITGKNIACYEAGAVPDDATTPYVIIADIATVENSNKTGFGNNVQILVDIVTSFEKNKIGGSKQADEIAGEILENINSKINFPIIGDLQIVNTKVLQDQKINSNSDGFKTSGNSGTNRIYRRLIRFQHLIMEV